MLKNIKNFLTKSKLKEKENENLLLLLGQFHSKLNNNSNYQDINEKEFKVFSQWGEDGIIDYLISALNINDHSFIEFGVENYKEANTKFLLLNRNWSGMILDSSKENIQSIKESEIYWKYDLTVLNEFVTKDNINQLIKNNFDKKIGLLSIDVDGNDYWIWESIETINPSIVIVEYNARFGNKKKLVVPYKKNFDRKTEHYSMIYYGASLQALADLGNKKGYKFICCNKAGNNAFFVKKDLINDQIKFKSLTDGFYKNKFRESRDKNGNLIFLNEEEEREIISNLPLVEV